MTNLKTSICVLMAAKRMLLFIALLIPVLLTPGGLMAQQVAGLEYRIGPEDVLHISVWKEEDLDRKVLVRPDGGVCV